MPEIPQSSAIAPELGRVFTPDTKGNLYGTDSDLSIPTTADFNG